jgi:hypothetical protein
MKQLHQARLLTILAEANLEDTLRDRIKDWGVSEYSATQVISRLASNGESLDRDKLLVRIEVVASPGIIDSIFKALHTEYPECGSVTCYVSDVVTYHSGTSTPRSSHRMKREQFWADHLITI